MTPYEEAKELYHKMLTCQPDKYLAKQCALICVDEILKECHAKYECYYEHVKVEIEKL